MKQCPECGEGMSQGAKLCAGCSHKHRKLDAQKKQKDAAAVASEFAREAAKQADEKEHQHVQDKDGICQGCRNEMLSEMVSLAQDVLEMPGAAFRMFGEGGRLFISGAWSILEQVENAEARAKQSTPPAKESGE